MADTIRGQVRNFKIAFIRWYLLILFDFLI